jgi:hypothetical protein
MSARVVTMTRSRWLPTVLIGFLILIMGIGIGAAGTVGVGLVARHFHRGPAVVGPYRHNGQPPRFGPPAQRFRPGMPFKPGPIQPLPGKPGAPAAPGSPAPSPTG